MWPQLGEEDLGPCGEPAADLDAQPVLVRPEAGQQRRRRRAGTGQQRPGRRLPLLDRGTVRPVVDALLPLARVAEAYELLASDATFGKVVLDCR